MQDNQPTARALTLLEEDRVSIVVGNETHRGTLLYEKDFDRWIIRPDGHEPGEDIIVIAKF